MARRKSGVNVSQAIRDYLKDNNGIGPSAAAEAISKQIGVKVTPTYVSNIKALGKKKGSKPGKRGRKPGSKLSSLRIGGSIVDNGMVAVDSLASLKALVRSVGSEMAKSLIDLLA